MGKTTEGIKISLNVSLKGSPKEVFPTKKKIKIFLLKFSKNTIFYPNIKNWHFRGKCDGWFSQLWKNYRESLTCYQETHIFQRYPLQIIRCLWWTFEEFLASQWVGLFFWQYLCTFYWKEGWVCMMFCVTEYSFHETKKFSGIVKKLHFG